MLRPLPRPLPSATRSRFPACQWPCLSRVFPRLPALSRTAFLALAAGLGLPSSPSFADHPAGKKAGTEASPRAGWTVPDAEVPPGLRLEVAAGAPLVRHPIMAALDDKGRLFVAENAGLNLDKAALEEQKPNSLVRLEDTDGDGVYDEKTVFATGLTFPQGALWVQDALYVLSPPSLWRFVDENDDGVAESREELVTGFDYTGNAADVHGPFLHPSGRLFWCHGRKGHEVHDPGTGKLVSKGKGARLWSCRPDGSDVQVHAGGGMDNPVEVDFTDEGEIIGTVNLFHGRPRGDVLVHWIWGGVYPRDDQESVLAEFPRSGPLLPEFHDFGHVAVSGMTRYRTGALNESWRDNWLVTHFNTRMVTRTAVEPSGSTLRATETETILRLNQPDAHLTDVLETPEGDLLIVDTGGWFRIGCPTSQVAKPEVAGAIYRLRRAEEKPAVAGREDDPYGLKDDWAKLREEALGERLGAASPVVREKAMAELATRGEPSLGVLEALSADQEIRPAIRVNAVFTLARMDFTDATLYISRALDDSHPEVRVAACHALLATRSREALEAHDPKEAKYERQLNRDLETTLMALCRDGRHPAVQRAAAAVLGRIGTGRAAGALLGVAGREETDAFLAHAAAFALIQIADPEATLPGLEPGNARRQAAALRALDQMKDSPLDPLAVLPLLESGDPGLRDAAVEVAARHADWDAALANRFRDWLDNGQLAADGAHLAIVERVAPHFLATPPMPALIGQLLDAGNEELTAAAYRSLAASPATLPAEEAWLDALRGTLSGPVDSPLLPLALRVAGRLPSPNPLARELGVIATDASRPSLQRIHALGAGGTSRGASLSPEVWSLLLDLLEPGSATGPGERLEACRLLGEARLSAAQLAALAPRLDKAGPMELPLLLPAFMGADDATVGEALASALPLSPGLPNIPPGDIERLTARLPTATAAKFQPVLDRLRSAAAQRAGRLAELEPELEKGDATRGRAVFTAGKGACSTCHQVGGIGRPIGPDLSTIGAIRTRRDLLESILFPSESLARDFEACVVKLKDGTAHLGLLHRQNADTLYLTTAAGEEIPLPRAQVITIEPAPLSLMPQGLDQALTKEELLDLVAFLKSLGSS